MQIGVQSFKDLREKELFKGLAIEKLEDAEKGKREIWQEYPVLYLDFNAGIYNTREGFLNVQSVILIDEYDKPLLYFMDNEAINEEYRAILKACYSVIKSTDLDGNVEMTFAGLSDYRTEAGS